MAMPKKGSRSILVDGQHYRWSVRCTEDDMAWNDYGMHTSLTVAVESYQNPHGMLCIRFQCGFDESTGRGPRRVKTGEEMEITPNQVAEWIRVAIKQGWKPQANGAKLCITL